jgi:hypothetical protein
MKKSILLSLVAFMIASLNAANTYRATPDAPGGGDGQSWEKPMTINEAIAKIADKDTILCKAGEYLMTKQIAISKGITFKGGLAGEIDDDEKLALNDARSVFNAKDIAIQNAFYVSGSGGGACSFIGIEIRNAYFRGMYFNRTSSLSLENCVFDSCGTNYTTEVANADVQIRGAGGNFKGSTSHTLSLKNCVFSRNTYEANVGTKVGNGIAATFSAWKNVTIENSLFVSNGVGRAALKSTSGNKISLTNLRGVLYVTGAPLTVRNTKFIANTAGIYTGTMGAMGGVIYIYKSKGKSSFENCLFLGNSCEHCYSIDKDTKEAGVIVVRSDSSGTKDSLDVVNCTFAYNFTDGKITSAGIDVGSYDGTTANIKNTIFYGAKKSRDSEKGRDIWVSSGWTANIDYCLFDSDGKENIEKCIAGAGTKTIGSNNVFGDPKFARTVTADEIASIMVNNGSYYGYSVDAYETVFSKADVHALSRKLTVDTGDPASPYSNEPRPNGKRVNLGYYGNTPEALTTLSGMKIIVR